MTYVLQDWSGVSATRRLDTNGYQSATLDARSSAVNWDKDTRPPYRTTHSTCWATGVEAVGDKSLGRCIQGEQVRHPVRRRRSPWAQSGATKILGRVRRIASLSGRLPFCLPLTSPLCISSDPRTRLCVCVCNCSAIIDVAVPILPRMQGEFNDWTKLSKPMFRRLRATYDERIP